jgi:hypothetical protein
MSSLAGKSKGEDRDPGFSDEVVKIFKVEGEEKQLRNYIRWVVVLLILDSNKKCSGSTTSCPSHCQSRLNFGKAKPNWAKIDLGLALMTIRRLQQRRQLDYKVPGPHHLCSHRAQRALSIAARVR